MDILLSNVELYSILIDTSTDLLTSPSTKESTVATTGMFKVPGHFKYCILQNLSPTKINEAEFGKYLYSLELQSILPIYRKHLTL